VVNVAIVTGAGQGIGAATAEAFAAEGYAVALLDLDEAKVAATAARLGGKALALKCDVGERASVEAALKTVEQRLGPVTALINNAGIGGPFHRVDEVTDDEWERIVSTNLRSVFYFARALLPGMKARGQGRIVNIASIYGLRGAAGSSTYCATKHAVVGYTRALADEWGAHGITCNAICPGFVDTPMTNAEQRSRVEAITPVRRMAEPSEIAALALYLCGPKAGYINGAIWAVDGGITSRV
jgi:3-oxoacyl-[acyl-carrier protein] reductase